MMLLNLRTSARSFKLLATLVASAAIAVGCGSDPTGHSIFDTGGAGGAGGGSQGPGGLGGSSGNGNPTSGTGKTAASSGTTSGSGTSTSGSGIQQANFTVALESAALDIDLAATISVNVTVKPNGYVGPVNLQVTDLGPDVVTAKLASPSVTLDGATNAVVKLTLTTLASTPPQAVKFTVSAIVANGTKTADGALTVHSAITFTIPAGVDGMEGTQGNPNTKAFGSYPAQLVAPANLSGANPVTVRFFNADNKAHQIHAGNNAQGFPHDPAPIGPNSMDNLVRSVNAKGTYDFYLHDEGSPLNVGRIVIQ
jgi:hypothetical protein